MKISILPLSQLLPDPDNPRKTYDEIARQALAESIRLHGVKVPLIAYLNALQQAILIDGQCRWEAAGIAGLTKVPVALLDKTPSPAELMHTRLTINCHRTDLNQVDLAESFDSLMKLKNLNASQLAADLGISPSSVSYTLSIMRLTPEERKQVREGKVTKTGLYNFARMPPEQRAEYLERVVNGDVSRDTLAAKVKRKQPGKPTGLSRVICHVAAGTLTFASKAAITMDMLITGLEDALKEARKARADSLEVSTLSKLLKDKARRAM